MKNLLRLAALAALAGCAVHRPVAGPVAAAAAAERAPRVFEYRAVGAEMLHAFVFAPATRTASSSSTFSAGSQLV